jgi:hypothetical protein
MNSITVPAAIDWVAAPALHDEPPAEIVHKTFELLTIAELSLG